MAGVLTLAHQSLALLDLGLAVSKRWLGLRRPGVVSVYFHGIRAGNSGNLRDPQENLGLDDLEQAIHYFKQRGYQWIAATDLGPALDPAQCYAVLTCDDGYFNVSKAFPLLRREGVPITLFIATEYCLTQEMYWWDRLHLDGQHRGFAKTLKHLPDSPEARQRLLDAGEIKAPRQALDDENRVFTPEELKAFMADPLLVLGNHTGNHLSLPALTGAAIQQETALAETRMKTWTGAAPKVFAFPYGHYDAKTLQALEPWSFQAMFSTEPGRVEPSRWPDRSGRRTFPRYQIHGGKELIRDCLKADMGITASHRLKAGMRWLLGLLGGQGKSIPEPRRPTVTFLEEVVPQYRAPFFAAVRTRLEASGVSVRLAHGNAFGAFAQRKDTVPLDWATPVRQWSFHAGRRTFTWLELKRVVRGTDLIIVSQEVRQLSNIYLFLLQGVGRVRVAFWGHGKDFSKASVTGPIERLKAFLSRRAHWWFAYNGMAARTVQGLGYPAERISTVMNAVDTGALVAARTGRDLEPLAALRRTLGLGQGPVGIYVGAMDAIKGLPYLLAACQHIRGELPDFEMLMVGAGSELSALQAATVDAPWIHWLPPTFAEEKGRLLQLADLFLLPAWVGLGIVDAFAAGCPLVASDAFPHSVEIDYLEHGVNGYWVRGNPSPEQYGQAVVALFRDPAERARLVAGCIQAAERYTLDAMVERFAEGVLKALAAPRLDGVQS